MNIKAKAIKGLKKLCDYAESKNLLKIVQNIDWLGYSRKDNNIIVYKNGDLDLNTGKFIEKDYTLKDNQHYFECHLASAAGIQDALIGYSSFIDEILTDNAKAYLVRGYLVAGVWKKEISQIVKGFPMLYFYGIRGIGKSQCLFFLARLCGVSIDVENYVYDINTGTNFTMLSFLGKANYYLFLDEYQGGREKWKDENLKGNYLGTPMKRGTVKKKGAVSEVYPNKSVLCVAGESITDNEALFTRSVYIDLQPGDYKPVPSEKYEKIVSYYHNYFVNILRQKNEITPKLQQTIKDARSLVDKYAPEIKEGRIKNNIITVVSGNLLAGIIDEKLHADGIQCFVDTNKDLLQHAGIASQIIDDICLNPDYYISLNEAISKSSHLPLFLTDKGLAIVPQELVKRYCLKNRKTDISEKKVANELVNSLGIKKKLNKYIDNYHTIYQKKRSKTAVIPLNEININNNAIRLWNATYNKFSSEIGKVSIDLGKYDATLIHLQKQLDKHTELKELD